MRSKDQMALTPNHPALRDIPELPYAGTSGWSGSDTSEERARTEDRDGTTTRRQIAVMQYLTQRGASGATWRELAEAMGWHHGQASGALSVLHKTGHIARLVQRRDRCAVYVRWEYRGDRDFAMPKPNKRKCCPHCGGDL